MEVVNELLSGLLPTLQLALADQIVAVYEKGKDGASKSISKGGVRIEPVRSDIKLLESHDLIDALSLRLDHLSIERAVAAAFLNDSEDGTAVELPLCST